MAKPPTNANSVPIDRFNTVLFNFPTEEYNRAVYEETAKLQAEHQNGNHNKSNELPATGKLNNTVLNLSIGTLFAFVGGLAILISRKYNFEK